MTDTPKRPTKPYGIYHWDTFEALGEGTELIGEADSMVEAVMWIVENHRDKLKPTGADRVEIVYYADATKGGEIVGYFKYG